MFDGLPLSQENTTTELESSTDCYSSKEEQSPKTSDLNLLYPSLPSTSTKDIPVGGRLQRFADHWEELGASEFIVGVLREGYQIGFHGIPPTTHVPCNESTSLDRRKDQLIEDHIQELLQKEAIEEVQGPVIGKSFFSRLFMVPKQNGKWRPVIDLKRLNKYVKVPKFKMETISSVWTSLIPNNFCMSIDLTDAYFHVPVATASRKYLRILRNGRVYQFKALPFGLSSSPWIFTQVIGEVKKMVHKNNILMYNYLDDWLIQVTTFNQGIKHMRFLLKLCDRLGLMVNWEKSELVPSQDFSFIGAKFNLLLERVFPQDKNIEKLQNIIKLFLRFPSQTANIWQSLLGSMTSQQKYVHLARLFTRPIQFHLMENWTQGVDNPQDIVQFPPHLDQYLRWWLDKLTEAEGVPLVHPPFTVRMWTDASKTGWGAHVGKKLYQGDWDSEESDLPINILEMRAVKNALIENNPPEGSNILVSTDNISVMAYINKEGGTHSKDLMTETCSLFNLLMDRGWNLKATYIPGKLNVVADQLSRKGQTLPTEWSIHQQAIDQVFKRWFVPMIDLFATRYNSKCRMFVSPVPDELAIETDALQMDLEGIQAYAYPPHQILGNLLQKFQKTQNCSLIVVAPYWPKQTWLPLLNRLSSQSPYSYLNGKSYCDNQCLTGSIQIQKS